MEVTRLEILYNVLTIIDIYTGEQYVLIYQGNYYAINILIIRTIPANIW